MPGPDGGLPEYASRVAAVGPDILGAGLCVMDLQAYTDVCRKLAQCIDADIRLSRY